MVRLLILNPSLAETVCDWMCKHPKLAASLGRASRPDLPKPLAEDRFKHTYRSYSETLDKVILAAGAAAGIGEVAVPVQLVAGGADSIMDHDLLHQVTARHAHVRLSVWPGGQHELPLTDTVACVGEIRRMREELVPGLVAKVHLASDLEAEGSASPELPR